MFLDFVNQRSSPVPADSRLPKAPTLRAERHGLALVGFVREDHSKAHFLPAFIFGFFMQNKYMNG